MLQNQKKIKTEISEIFSSIQGEGFYMGARQIFVRFGRCNMHCEYCDELPKMQTGAYENLDTNHIHEVIQKLESERGPHHSVSFTGGEPLMYLKALDVLLETAHQEGLKTYVETNATFPSALQKVLDRIDILSIDLKPVSSSSDSDYWKQHRDFLKIAAEKEGYVKVVVTSATTEEDLLRSEELVRSVAPKYRLVFQPVSDKEGPNLKVWNRLEERRIRDTSLKNKNPYWVIPQMHKIWKIR